MSIRESKLRRYKNKAAEFVEKGKYVKALSIYKDILSAFPDDATIMLKIGDLCKKLDMDNEAIAVYSNAAQYYAKKGDLLKGIAVCKLIMEIDFNHRDTQKIFAKLYTSQYGRWPSLIPKRESISPKHNLPSDNVNQDDTTASQDHFTPVTSEKIKIDFRKSIELTDENQNNQEEEFEELDEKDILEEKSLDPIDIKSSRITKPEDLVVEMSTPPDFISQPPEIPLFSDLDEETFLAVLNSVPIVRFDALETVVKEGEPGNSFFIILSGSVEVVKGETSVATLDEGTFFGEMSIVHPGPRRASVITTEPCELLEISNDYLAELKKAHPQIAYSLFEFTEKRLLNNLMLTSPLFEPFSDEEKNDLIKKFESCSFPKGKIVIEEGTENEFLYLVVLGELKVTARNSKGENLEVAILKEGDSFGEISLLNKGIPLATVTTMASCRLLKLPHGKFIEMIMTHPQVLELMAAISNNRINLLKQLAPQKIASSKGEGCALL